MGLLQTRSNRSGPLDIEILRTAILLSAHESRHQPRAVDYVPTVIGAESYVMWYDDFIGDQLLDEYSHTNIGTGSGAVNDQVGGVYRLTTGAALGSQRTTTFGAYYPFSASKNPIIIIKYKANRTVDHGVDIGIYSAAARGFLLCLSCPGGVPTTEVQYGLPADRTELSIARDVLWHTIKMVVTSTTATFYIDGAFMTSHSHTVADSMKLYLHVDDAGGVTNNAELDIDYVLMYQDR